jgi:hypothetical protein
LVCTAPTASGTVSTADGYRPRARGKGGAQSRGETVGTVFMGGGPACATPPYARRCLGARGTLVGAPGGEGSRRTAGLCANAVYGSVRRGGAHGLQGHLGVRVSWGRSGAWAGSRGAGGRRAAALAGARLGVATASPTEQCSWDPVWTCVSPKS